MIRTPAPTPINNTKRKAHKKKVSNVSIDSSTAMATFDRFRRSRSPITFKKKKKQICDEGDGHIKRNKKARDGCNRLDDGFSLADSAFFQNYPCYDPRTVNSFAEVSHDEFDLCTKVLRKKKKMEPIDSEVELMMTKAQHRPVKFSDIAPKIPCSLVTIRENIENELLEMRDNMKYENNKRRNSNKNKFSEDSSKRHLKLDEAGEKYPVLKDKELIKKFLSVQLTNNQKGRIRQVLRDILRGTSTTILPDVINNKISAILRSSQNLTDTDLRKIRVLFNMLKTATDNCTKTIEKEPEKVEEDVPTEETVKKKKKKVVKEGEREKKEIKYLQTKMKGPKRYIVFVGNLPPNVTKAEVKSIFPDIYNYIIDVRIPKSDLERSAFAYVELSNLHSFEIALSKHHTMLGKRRVNVLYTTQICSKISKTEAKAKVAKLLEMHKRGQLIGSRALKGKRSQRRAKQRIAMKAAEEKQKNIKK